MSSKGYFFLGSNPGGRTRQLCTESPWAPTKLNEEYAPNWTSLRRLWFSKVSCSAFPVPFGSTRNTSLGREKLVLVKITNEPSVEGWIFPLTPYENSRVTRPLSTSIRATGTR